MVRSGQNTVRLDQKMFKSNKSGQVWAGQVRVGQTRYSQVISGKSDLIRLGQKMVPINCLGSSHQYTKKETAKITNLRKITLEKC